MKALWLDWRAAVQICFGTGLMVSSGSQGGATFGPAFSLPVFLLVLAGGCILVRGVRHLRPHAPVVAFITLDAAEALKRDLERGRDPFKGRLH